MISRNNDNYHVFSEFNEHGQKLYFQVSYKKYLERMTKDGCKEDYKKCGILDTYGNSFCLLTSSDCPMNKLKFDYTSTLEEYQNNGYYHATVLDNSNIYLYFKRGELNTGVIVNWIYQESQPKYINDNNFIFDMDAFEECFGSTEDDDKDDDYDDDDDDDDDDDINSKIGKEVIDGTIDFAGDLIKDSVKLARINKLIDFIDEKINKDPNNIDYNYTYIGVNNYVKNYLGFASLEDLNDFKKIDFGAYKKRYPTFTGTVFAIIFMIIFFGYILFFLFLLIIKKEYPDRSFKLSVIFYVPCFLGFFIYSVVVYAKDYKNPTFDIAKKIKADKFIEDFLKDFYEPFEKGTLIIIVIIVLIVSALLFIAFWVIEPINECIEKRRIKKINDLYDRRIIYSNNVNNQQNVNNNINRNQLNTEVYQVGSNRVLKENVPQTESNVNQNENNDMKTIPNN